MNKNNAISVRNPCRAKGIGAGKTRLPENRLLVGKNDEKISIMIAG
ncbi:hypothetical protein [Methylomicrobium sp. Wu6]|nr:hypothetical protein [Methylomicrobium sp. Wu6]